MMSRICILDEWCYTVCFAGNLLCLMPQTCNINNPRWWLPVNNAHQLRYIFIFGTDTVAFWKSLLLLLPFFVSCLAYFYAHCRLDRVLHKEGFCDC